MSIESKIAITLNRMSRHEQTIIQRGEVESYLCEVVVEGMTDREAKAIEADYRLAVSGPVANLNNCAEVALKVQLLVEVNAAKNYGWNDYLKLWTLEEWADRKRLHRIAIMRREIALGCMDENIAAKEMSKAYPAGEFKLKEKLEVLCGRLGKIGSMAKFTNGRKNSSKLKPYHESPVHEVLDGWLSRGYVKMTPAEISDDIGCSEPAVRDAKRKWKLAGEVDGRRCTSP